MIISYHWNCANCYSLVLLINFPSNAEYYGPSLFLLATDVVTAYVFQVYVYGLKLKSFYVGSILSQYRIFCDIFVVPN